MAKIIKGKLLKNKKLKGNILKNEQYKGKEFLKNKIIEGNPLWKDKKTLNEDEDENKVLNE